MTIRRTEAQAIRLKKGRTDTDNTQNIGRGYKQKGHSVGGTRDNAEGRAKAMRKKGTQRWKDTRQYRWVRKPEGGSRKRQGEHKDKMSKYAFAFVRLLWQTRWASRLHSTQWFQWFNKKAKERKFSQEDEKNACIESDANERGGDASK